MKRLLTTIGIVAMSSMAFSQSAYDALTLSRTNPVLGTARYSGMAGAFNALGGNASAIKDNPAALGVYRSSELTFSPSLYINNDSEVKGALDNFAFVINFGNKKRKHGYVTSSLGINYNRINNISRYTSVSDDPIPFSVTDYIGQQGPQDYTFQDATSLGLLDEEGYSVFGGSDGVLRNYTLMEKGHVGQWDIAYGLNISNLLYVGAAFGFNTIDYKQTAMYDETTLPGEPDDAWYLDNEYYATGHGFNFRLGAIVKPVDFLRVGASFETPTYYDLEESYSKEIGDDYDYIFDDGGGSIFYSLRTPLKFKAGLGFVIGKRAMIGIDYQYENYQKIRMKYDDINLKDQTKVAENEMCKVNTIKAGAEVQVVEGFSLRTGVAYSSKPMENYEKKDAMNIANFRILTFPQQSLFVTGGAGYKGEHFYCDLAYVFQNTKNYLYPTLPLDISDEPLEEDLKTRNIIATIGWRF